MRTAIVTKGSHRLRCLLVETPEERAVGLSRSSSVPEDGMLFDLGVPLYQSMTMHETAIPLGMVWISERGIVVATVPRALPFRPTPYRLPFAAGPARWVLEVSPETFARCDFWPRDRVSILLPANI